MRDPAKLFGIVQALKPLWLLLKACKAKGKGKGQGKSQGGCSWWSRGQQGGAPEGEQGPCGLQRRCAWRRHEGARKHEALDSLRGSSVKLVTIQRRLAWPLRKDDTHESRSVDKRQAGNCPQGHELTLQTLNRGWCDACGARIAEDSC